MNCYIYNKVNKLIKKYKTREPLELIKALKINLIYLSGTNKLLGMYHYFERNRFIFISENLNFNKNIVLAHELGHDQLHREYCKRIKAFSQNNILNPTNIYEKEANIFAAHLLISDDLIYQNLKENTCDYELAGELELDINLLISKYF